jgi:hypothetical protein
MPRGCSHGFAFAPETDHVTPGGVEINVGHDPFFAASADDTVLCWGAVEIPDFISIREAEADTNGHLRSDATQSERKTSDCCIHPFGRPGPEARSGPHLHLVAGREVALPSTSLTVRLPTGDRHYTFVEVVPSEGHRFHVAGQDWIVAHAREGFDGAVEIELSPIDVVGHSRGPSETDER